MIYICHIILILLRILHTDINQNVSGQKILSKRSVWTNGREPAVSRASSSKTGSARTVPVSIPHPEVITYVTYISYHTYITYITYDAYVAGGQIKSTSLCALHLFPARHLQR